MNKQVTIVAVDGPSASGKSTVSRKTAEAIGFMYVDSGALYRGITWKCVRENVDVKDTQAVTNLLIRMTMDLVLRGNAVGYLIDGEDPGQEIRGEAVRERVADIAAQQPVRVYIVEKLRQMTKFGNLVMEGRDIGTVVFPDAQLKIYLDASPAERAKRRYEELLEKGHKQDYDAVLADILQRDTADSSRALAPLKPAEDAIIIDSTLLSIEALNLLIYTEYLRRMV